jgi:hypothetical protein
MGDEASMIFAPYRSRTHGRAGHEGEDRQLSGRKTWAYGPTHVQANSFLQPKARRDQVLMRPTHSFAAFAAAIRSFDAIQPTRHLFQRRDTGPRRAGIFLFLLERFSPDNCANEM